MRYGALTQVGGGSPAVTWLRDGVSVGRKHSALGAAAFALPFGAANRAAAWPAARGLSPRGALLAIGNCAGGAPAFASLRAAGELELRVPGSSAAPHAWGRIGAFRAYIPCAGGSFILASTRNIAPRFRCPGDSDSCTRARTALG